IQNIQHSSRREAHFLGMVRMFRRISASLGAALCLGGLAPIAEQGDPKAAYQTCIDGASTPAAAIAACSSVITSGKVDGTAIGFIYLLRGKSLRQDGREGPAAEDFANAVRHNPALPDSLVAFG